MEGYLDIEFIEVTKSKEHISELYDILQKRSHNISHIKMPTLQEHTDFVKNHPYRKWYLISIDNLFEGAMYIQNDNTISLNLITVNFSVVKKSLDFILENHQPLEGIPSVRSNKFNLNVPPANQALIDCLRSYGSKLIEMRYVIKK